MHQEDGIHGKDPIGGLRRLFTDSSNSIIKK
jgi:hypothetical protein